MRIPFAVRVLTITGLALSAACAGDGPVAPSADVAEAMLAVSAAPGAADTRTEVLTVDPTRTRVYRVGHHWLYIPANAICEAGSSYGPTEWDKPCTLATEPLQITIAVGEDAAGNPTARISPDLRFAPSTNPTEWVVLGLKVSGRLDTQGYGILYQPTGSTELIDEAATDPTLRAWRAPGNVIARRLKHFSGYNVSLGFQEQESRLDIGWGAY